MCASPYARSSQTENARISLRSRHPNVVRVKFVQLGRARPSWFTVVGERAVSASLFGYNGGSGFTVFRVKRVTQRRASTPPLRVGARRSHFTRLFPTLHLNAAAS